MEKLPSSCDAPSLVLACVLSLLHPDCEHHSWLWFFRDLYSCPQGLEGLPLNEQAPAPSRACLALLLLKRQELLLVDCTSPEFLSDPALRLLNQRLWDRTLNLVFLTSSKGHS